MARVTTDLRVGSTLAGYRVDGVLGRGGMGVVYRAEHLTLHRVVALKLVAPELTMDPRFRERFLAESRLAASLEHPNVIPIYDAGEADGELYLAMRIVEGKSLRELLAADGRLLPARALDLLAPVAAALDAAHARGLVHRDVKPANILIEDKHVYLSDFGLARLAGEARPDEMTHLSGSLAYVAPEQATEPAVDARADVYSLGCVLFECLTGEPPYGETSPLSLLWAHVSEPVPEASERRPELPQAIDAVLATALAKEPEDRYEACRELTDAAAEALGLRWLIKARRWEEEGRDRSSLLRGSDLSQAEASVAAGPEALTSLQLEFVRTSRAAVSRRQRLVVAASVAVAAVAVVLLVFALISRSRATSEASRADAATLVARSRVLAAESEGQLSVDPERSILLAAAAVRTSPTDEAVFALRQALDRSPLLHRLRSVGSQAVSKGPGIAYSPDGKRLIEGSDNGMATVFDTATGRVLRRFQSGNYAAIVGWSPDGSQIAVEAGCALTIRDAATYKLLATTNINCNGPGYSYAFSPDGSLLYYADCQTVYRWNIRTKRLDVFPGRFVGGTYFGTYFDPCQVSLSPDGRRLAVAGYPGVELLDARSGRALTSRDTGPGNGDGTISVAFSPDGTQLAAAEWRGASGFNGSAITLLDGHTLARRATVARVRGSIFTSVAFSPDGARVAYGASDGTAGIYSLSSRQLVSLPGHTTFIFQVAFSPDGRSLATAGTDGTTLIWRATTNERLAIDAGGIDPSVGGSSFDQADLTFPGDIVVRTARTTGALAGQITVEAWRHDGARAGAPLVIGKADDSTAASLSVDGRFAVTAPSPITVTAGSMGIWDVAARRVRHALVVPAVISAPRLSPDSSRVAFSVIGQPNSTMEIIDVATGRAHFLGSTACGGIDSAPWQAWDFSLDGSLLAATDGCGELAIWNVATGRVVGRRVRFGDLSYLGPVRFSPDGKRLAVANTNNVGQVSIIDVATGHVVADLKEHTRTVQDVAFSPNGELVATAGLDGTARVWDARAGRPLRVIPVPAAVNNVAFSPDSRSLATLDFGGTVRVWDACTACDDPDALLALAAKRVTRELTPSERRTFGVE